MLVWCWLSALSEPLPLTSEVVSRSRGQLTVPHPPFVQSRSLMWNNLGSTLTPAGTRVNLGASHCSSLPPSHTYPGCLWHPSSSPPVLQSSHASSSLTDRPVHVYHSAWQQPLFSQIFCRQAVTASHWAPDKELAKCLIVKSINTPRLPRIVAHTSFGKVEKKDKEEYFSKLANPSFVKSQSEY